MLCDNFDETHYVFAKINNDEKCVHSQNRLQCNIAASPITISSLVATMLLITSLDISNMRSTISLSCSLILNRLGYKNVFQKLHNLPFVRTSGFSAGLAAHLLIVI